MSVGLGVNLCSVSLGIGLWEGGGWDYGLGFRYECGFRYEFRV